MDPREHEGCMWLLILLLVAAISVCFGFVSGASKAITDMEKDATIHNVGEYYLDKDNNKQFRWIECASETVNK